MEKLGIMPTNKPIKETVYPEIVLATLETRLKNEICSSQYSIYFVIMRLRVHSSNTGSSD